MLKEFNRLAREMLFLHGHLVRPADWAQNSAADAPQGGRRVETAIGEIDQLDRRIEIELEIGMPRDELRQTRH